MNMLHLLQGLLIVVLCTLLSQPGAPVRYPSLFTTCSQSAESFHWL